MTEFFLYIKKPINPNGFININWGYFFLMLLIYLAFSIPFGVVGLITLKLTGIARLPMEFSLYKKIIFGIVLAPIYEEILMRLLLVFNRRNMAIFIACCAVFFVYYFIKSSPKFLIFSLLTAVFSIVYLYHDKCGTFLNTHYQLFFYFIAALFGLMHIFNFTGINWNNLIFTPLLVLPQIFLGLILGYLRVTYGFIYGILFHAIVNISILLA